MDEGVGMRGRARACAAVDEGARNVYDAAGRGAGVRSRGLWRGDARGCAGEQDVMDKGARAREAVDEGSGVRKSSWDVAEGAGEA